MLDQALFASGFSEEDVRQVAFEQELLESKEAKDVFSLVAKEIEKHLSCGGDDSEVEPQDELSAANDS